MNGQPSTDNERCEPASPHDSACPEVDAYGNVLGMEESSMSTHEIAAAELAGVELVGSTENAPQEAPSVTRLEDLGGQTG